jgi:hypothetical protein
MPKLSARKPLIGPRRPNKISRMYPVTTGGRISGSRPSR